MNVEVNQYTAEQVEKLINQMTPVIARIEQDFVQGVVIYGAGFVGTWASSYLQSEGVNISHYIDRDTKKNGQLINGIPVVLPEPEVLQSVSSMFIAARHAVQQVEQSFSEYSFNTISFDGYFVAKNYSRLSAIRDDYLEDERSVETFNALLVAMLTGELASCKAVMEKDMYFGLPEFSGNFEDTFVDDGAFTGDTVERFIWENLGTFKHIYAFEPGWKQFKAMQVRMKRLTEEWAIPAGSVSLEKAGLSSSAGRMTCTFVDDSPLRHGLTEDTDNQIIDETISSEVYTLDSYLDGRPVSFIKADVEGMEMALLHGAQQTIRQYKPKMALCVYHYPCDLYEIAEFVRSLVPEYTFRLRQHVQIFGDFVLYCHVE